MITKCWQAWSNYKIVRLGAVIGLLLGLVGLGVFGFQQFNPTDELWFVGHTRCLSQAWFSDYNGQNPGLPTTRQYYRGQTPMDRVVREARRQSIPRVVFGGDMVFATDPQGWAYLKALKAQLPQSRYVIGNHEAYTKWQFYKAPAFNVLFHQRFYAEDVDGVRLIYFDSNNPHNDTYSLSPEGVDFLKSALNPKQPYRYAVLFLHHALWMNVPQDQSPFDPRFPKDNAQRWKREILPLLNQGRVKLVLAGDMLPPYGSDQRLGGIVHIRRGWPSPWQGNPEWIGLRFYHDQIGLRWHQLLLGRYWVTQEERF